MTAKWQMCLHAMALGFGLLNAPPPACASLDQVERQVMALEQQTAALQQVRLRFLATAGRGKPLTLNPERTRALLWEAKTHLMLGDTARALEIAMDAQKGSSALDNTTLHIFLKIQYESERKLGRLENALATCRRFLESGVRDDEWFLSCSQTVARRAHEKPSAVRSTLVALATAPNLDRSHRHLLPTAIVLAAAFERLGERQSGSTLLTRALSIASPSDVWLPRAQLTKALFEIALDRDAPGGIRQLYAFAQPANSEAQSKTTTDSGTTLLAQMAIARYQESRGNLAEADKFFRLAMTSQEQLPLRQADPPTRAGVLPPLEKPASETTPLMVDPSHFRAEFATHLCAMGKGDECARALDDLADELPSRPVAEVLSHSRSLRSQGIQRLARLAGYAQTDLSFVERQLELERPLTLTELEARASALTTIAGNYGLNSAHLQNLSHMSALPRELTQSLRQAHQGLAIALTPAEVFLRADNPSAGSLALESLDALSRHLRQTALVLDGQCTPLWSPETPRPQDLRTALLARFRALDDDTSRRNFALESAPVRTVFQSVQSDTQTTLQSLFENRAHAAAVNFLLAQKKEQKREMWWRDGARIKIDSAKAMDMGENLAHKATLDFRMTLLQADIPSPIRLQREKTLPRVQKTLADLAALHQRQLARSSSNQGVTARQLWVRLQQIHERIVELSRDFRQLDIADRKQLAGEAQNLLVELNLMERKEDFFREGLRKELQKHLPLVAHELKPFVERFRDEIRLSLADTDGDVLKRNAETRRDLDSAAEERRRWIEALRESLRWGLGR